MICKAVIADGSGTAVSRRCLGVRNRTKPYVFSHKVAPHVDVGNLVCATAQARARTRPPLKTTIQASRSQCNGCIHVMDSALVDAVEVSDICKAVIAARNGTNTT